MKTQAPLNHDIHDMVPPNQSPENYENFTIRYPQILGGGLLALLSVQWFVRFFVVELNKLPSLSYLFFSLEGKCSIMLLLPFQIKVFSVLDDCHS